MQNRFKPILAQRRKDSKKSFLLILDPIPSFWTVVERNVLRFSNNILDILDSPEQNCFPCFTIHQSPVTSHILSILDSHSETLERR